MIIQKSKLIPEEVRAYQDGEDAYNIITDVADRIGYSTAGYGCYGYKIIEENGEWVAVWNRDRTCG